ncbi:enoyl-CoA hydratase/isomerase family protein [Ureibacillus sp. FSL K6-8385]|uniref:Enoyl-CoA hydratase/isomerase family protein n=1 Tax=Ureibacillus terrenus TaxID=118246 RepID=A0A540V4R8_9BACL|nr:enoyl-CoA hydratase/isomerase family protein [Ureibacillus terrenus]TQE91746.1 enoyl-CoA hydratase/isomerase family protein [Ureibacillus terrenus]
MDEEILVKEREDGIGIITLNRPQKKNALNISMRRKISEYLNRWKNSDHIGVVIITGAGNAFSSGFDLSEFQDPSIFDEIYESSAKYHRDVWHFPKPIIAGINGLAFGGGFDLAALCDLRVSSKDAAFSHPEVKFGAPPIYTPLRWIVGEGIAKDLCFTGRKMDAEKAYDIGFVNYLVEKEQVLGKSVEVAKRILESPRDTLRFTKSFMIKQTEESFEKAFSIEHDQAFKEVLFKHLKK